VPSTTRLSRSATTQLELYIPWWAGEIARFVVYIPSGYRVDLSSPPGTAVGLVVAWSGFGGHIGRLTADAPSTHIGNACAPGLHQAVWLMELDAGAVERPVPLFIDRTTGAETGLGGYRVEACLPSATETGRRIAMLELDFDQLTNPPRAGAYTWRAFVTPYDSRGPNERRTFEVRSTVPLPMRLTLHGRYHHTGAVLTGRFTSPAIDVSGMPVELFRKVGRYLEPVRWARTRAGGRYTFRQRIRGRATFRAATGAIAPCLSSPAPAGCVSETIAGVASAQIVVGPRRR
jgi:hypothetical protein